MIDADGFCTMSDLIPSWCWHCKGDELDPMFYEVTA